MQNKTNMFMMIYKKLEKEVIDLSYYIHFSDEEIRKDCNQIWTYSNQIADILIAINIQIESLFLELYKQEFKNAPDTIGKAINTIDKKWDLSAKKVRIVSKNMYFQDENGFGGDFSPMAYKPKDENDYYGAYCAVKHNRIETLYKANINVLLRALAALYILNIYYSYEKKEADAISEIDFSMGSEIFMVKYSINNISSGDVLLVEEDKEYLNKLSAYAEKIPNFDSGEFLTYSDMTLSPKRFVIRLNK